MSRIVDEKMAELSDRFGRRLDAKVDKVEEAWNAFGGGVSELRDLYRLIHTLAGSGTTFGYSRVSASALAIEEILLPVLGPVLAARSRMSAGECRRVQELMAQLRLAIGTPDAEEDERSWHPFS